MTSAEEKEPPLLPQITIASRHNLFGRNVDASGQQLLFRTEKGTPTKLTTKVSKDAHVARFQQLSHHNHVNFNPKSMDTKIT